ncbi:MAG: hypothetical protein EU543_00625 [Promethearchaeota archaeon]|nr:MAG: hypothetical protein EU543_00625 [Candidatus Lokiarchaeota archaeon]
MERITIIYWNKSTGPEQIIQYPPEKDSLSKDLLLKIWAKHELNKEEKMIEFLPENANMRYVSIIQKYEGEIYFLVLVYQEQDNIDSIITEYPDILANISKNLIQLINTNKITRAISEAFNSIKNYSKLDNEQNLLTFFKDKIKFTILKILRNGVISKNKLKDILKHEYGFSTINIDLILMSFIREKLILKKNIPGSMDCYFLMRDLTCSRIPPQNISSFFENIEQSIRNQIINNYKNALITFFNSYDSTQENNLNTILNLLVDKNALNLIKTLRENRLTVKKTLNILNNNEGLFNDMLAQHFIFESNGMVFLLTDIRFIKFVPSFIIKHLISKYKEREISLNEYLTHLEILVATLMETTTINYEII